MKQKVRKALAVSGMAIIIGSTGMAYSANAHEAKYRQEKEVHVKKEKIHQKVIVGTASNITSETLTLTRGKKKFSVQITPETKFIDQTGNETTLAAIKESSKIRVKGSLNKTTITAKKIKVFSK